MVAGLTAGAVAVDPALADDRLLELLDTRLELMDEVAAHKWRQDLAIEDPQREAAVLEQAVADALRHGLTPASSRAFFVAQIEAAKSIQRHWFRVWEADGEPGPAPDLETVVRPALSRLGDDILAAASRSRPISRRAFDAAVAVAGLDDAARGAVFQALVELEHFADRLEQILATGVLRIGTTGDYAPFSYRDGSAEAPRGIDIDLARNLAAALGVEAVFVATSWPDLMEDLAEGRYDVAMSGVSRTLERQKLGYQSAAYYVGGKTTIARCAEADRYGSLAAIDRAGVRVIVNPGGTNEQFVDGHIRQAAKVLHDDNRTIFAALVAGRADVMITDRIEVELQTARHPELCPTMPGTLSYQQKAYLMPRDEAWKAFVDTWLALALADGTVAAIFRDHGVEPR
jgi:cyclohexadienyl dehydratase